VHAEVDEEVCGVEVTLVDVPEIVIDDVELRAHRELQGDLAVVDEPSGVLEIEVGEECLPAEHEVTGLLIV